MSVKVGSARSSYGNTKRGDQAGGKEVSTQPWYKHTKGWRVFRAKNAAIREKLGLAMEHACKNDHIGYSQEDRSSLYNAVKDLYFDPLLCTKDVNTDCSALVRVCCAFAGIKLKDFTTSSEPGVLAACGYFEELTLSKYREQDDWLMRGDILVTKTKGHTVIVLTNGSKAEKNEIGTTLIVTNGKWNVRSGIGTAKKILATVHVGDHMELLGTDEESGWMNVCVTVNDQRISGWVSGKAVK